MGSKHQWLENGVIVTKGTALRGVFIESSLLGSVFDGIAERLGIPIGHIVIEAKRRDAKIYVDSMMKGLSGRIMKTKLLRRTAYDYMVKQAAAIGLAYVEILDYRPGESLILMMDSIYNPSLFTGDVCGAFESIEGVRAKAVHGMVGERLFMMVQAWPDEPEEERLELGEESWIHALSSGQLCPSCGVPSDLSRWNWSVEEGKVTDDVTGEWLVFVDTAGINAVFRELERELGEDIPMMIADLSREYYLRLDRKKGAPFLQDLRFLEYRGYGVSESVYPRTENGGKSVVIRNPWNAAMVAGCVSAACGLDGSTVVWDEPKEGKMAVHLS